MRRISISFNQKIDIGTYDVVFCITKLRSEIYVICLRFSSDPNVIFVFEDRNPFKLQKKIDIKQIQDPYDIASSEKDNCLYVSDSIEKCVWKITRETDDE